MKVDVVVDVGNSRIKWGRCAADGVQHVAILSREVADWEQQLRQWQGRDPLRWALASVAPQTSAALAHWLRKQGQRVWQLDGHRQLPLEVSLAQPDRVGLDRLLNAVAVMHDRGRGRLPAVIIDAGSAVTVDWVDEQGHFRGGAILPGLRLMAQALHRHTALLPLIQVQQPFPAVPGLDTQGAMQAGIFHAVVGGVKGLLDQLARQSVKPIHIFVTGGDAPVVKSGLDNRGDYWPWMTLEGLRLTAEAQPALVFAEP